jgi:hypothetical protein
MILIDAANPVLREAVPEGSASHFTSQIQIESFDVSIGFISLCPGFRPL